MICKTHMFLSRIIASGLVLLSPFAALASSDLPEEAIGYREGAYGLSQYETVNLSNGNLTLRIPLYTLRTDGGLTYDIALIHNSKMWETRGRCLDGDLSHDFPCNAELFPEDHLAQQEIATGIESFGFGWDLRPPRIVARATASDLRPLAWVDPSGAKHYLAGAPPWDHTEDSIPCEPTPDQPECYTTDGTNLRLTVVEFSADTVPVPLEIVVEAPDGTRYIHSHLVPQSMQPSTIPDVRLLNFRADVAGLYTSAIERGPFTSGAAANRITFEYCDPDEPDGVQCPLPGFPWLPSRISVEPGLAGARERWVELHYGTETVILNLEPDGQSGDEDEFRTVPVLDEVRIPAYDPGGRYRAPGPASIALTYELERFTQVIAEAVGDWWAVLEAPVLHTLTLPGEAGTFDFERGPFGGILGQVTLPSGAVVEYTYFDWPVAGSRCLAGNGGYCTNRIYCLPARSTEEYHPPDSGDVPHGGNWSFTTGVWSRVVRASDVTGEHSEYTQFDGYLSCRPDEWPYDFSFALDGGDATSYFWTMVSSSEWDPLDQHDGEAPGWQVEVHRFHPGTHEEFAIDHLAPMAGTDNGLPPVWPEGWHPSDPEPLRDLGAVVLRHQRIVRREKYDVGKIVPWSLLGEGATPGAQELSRYAYEAERSIMTDTASAAGAGNVLACTEPYDVLAGQPYGPDTCTSLTTETEVDAYLNPTSIQTVSSGWPVGDVSRSTARTMLVDDDNWYLSMPQMETTCVGASCGTKGFTWSWNESNNGIYRLTEEYQNPSGQPGGFSCSADCVKHAYGYDAAGNVETDTVSGGYGSGFTTLSPTTKTVWRHGRPAERWLENGSQELLLWQRDIDPWSTRARWHVGGDGAGFAYNYDQLGRVTDIAPVQGTRSGESWNLAMQVTPRADGLAGTQLLYGTHIDYLLPGGGMSFIRHKIFDADCSMSSNVVSCTEYGAYRERLVFDGQGRLMQTTERLPGGARRSRFDLHLLTTGDDADPCQPAADAGLGVIARFDLASEWTAGDSWPTDGCQSLDWTLTLLDGLGRPLRTTLPDGSIVTTAYQGDAVSLTTSNVVQTIGVAAEPVTRRQTTDGLGRLVRLEEQRLSSDVGSFPYLASYGYDHADRLVSVGLSVSGGAVQQRSFGYSASGFLTLAAEPERVANYTGYDALGNLRAELVGGVTTSYSFDHFGRPTDARIDSEPLRHLEYGAGAIGSSSYNKVVTAIQTNRFRAPAPVADIDVLHEWVYDGPGRRVSGRYTEIEGFGAPGDTFAISYDYDRWGNPRTTFFPEWMGCREDSSWAGAYRQWDGPWLTSVSLEASPTSRQQVASFGYLSTGRVGTINYANGLASWTEAPDPNGMARPSQISLDLGSNGSLEWLHGPFTYDGSGNITSIGQLGSPTAKRFAYDGVGRLTGFQYSPEGFNEGYGYDRWGNMTSFTRNGATTTFTMQSFGGVPSTNRVQGVMVDRTRGAFAYDLRGNLTSLPNVLDGQLAKSFYYSTEDRLLQSTDVASGFTWRYAYDAGGERVARWHRDGDDVDVDLYLRDESGAVVGEWKYLLSAGEDPALLLTREYVNGPGGTLAQLDYGAFGETLSFLAADHLGSSRVMFDATGITEQYDFVPFGGFAPWGDVDPDTTHLFTGHERDLGETSSGLDYMHARYYSSDLGRFLSVDPVGGKVGSSQSWNRYSYVLNNPLSATDPNGKDVLLVVRNIKQPGAPTWSRHSFLMVIPTGKNVDKYESRMNAANGRGISLSGTAATFPGESGSRVVKSENDPTDNMSEALQVTTIQPSDQTAEQFEQNVMEAFDSYQDGSAGYSMTPAAFPAALFGEVGNCNSLVSGVLDAAGAGESKPSAKQIDGSVHGWNQPINLPDATANDNIEDDVLQTDE